MLSQHLRVNGAQTLSTVELAIRFLSQQSLLQKIKCGQTCFCSRTTSSFKSLDSFCATKIRTTQNVTLGACTEQHFASAVQTLAQLHCDSR